MDKYFNTLNLVFKMHYRNLASDALKERMYLALDTKHDVGGEADHIIGIWKETIRDTDFNIRAQNIFDRL
jgi:hypothetical protein|tara:strand:+ start:1690 stop:1899 length:210 start_codon:yes stop_codon:yes gene_type:complete